MVPHLDSTLSTRVHLHSGCTVFVATISKLTSGFFSPGICVKSFVNPHVDLPPDIPMFAQLIIDGNTVKQSETMTPENSGNSWKLKFDCKM
jgi:hypothetical protein